MNWFFSTDVVPPKVQMQYN